MIVKRVGIFSVGKLMGCLYAVLGLILGGFMALITMSGVALNPANMPPNMQQNVPPNVAPNARPNMPPNAAPNMPPNMGGMLALMGVGAIIIMPIFYGFVGFIGGIVMAFFYNIVASIVGGIEIELAHGMDEQM